MPVDPKYAPLFQPLTLNNGITVKSRLTVAPIAHFGSHADGSVNDQERVFIGNHAGNMGLFIAAATLVQDDGKASPDRSEAAGEHYLDGLKETARLIQKQGAKTILQVHYDGYKVMTELNRCDKISTSTNETEGAREASTAEVDKLVASFTRAADLALRVGFDDVEIHDANSYLIQQFYSAQSNRHSDRWGGNLENRMRFPLAVVDAIAAVHDKHQRNDFTIGYRFSPEEADEDGLTMTETGTLIDAPMQKPLQYLHVSLWGFNKKIRRGGDTAQTRMQLIHEHINGKLSPIGMGNLFTANQILATYETGWAEFIVLGKTVMLNPYITTQILEGREAEIETQLDTARVNHYDFPDTLWKLAASGTQPWLLPVENTDWKSMDI